MSYRTYRLWKLLIIVVVAVLVGVAVTQGNFLLPIPAAVVGMVILLIIRRGVKEVVVDERTYNIANRATRMAFQTGILIMVLIGATMVALGKSEYADEFSTFGFTLIYSACGLLIVYLVGDVYYSRKYGGKE